MADFHMKYIMRTILSPYFWVGMLLMMCVMLLAGYGHNCYGGD